MRDISGDFVADLMVAISEQGQAPLLIISSSYGAIPTVRGIHAWQKRQPQQAILIGAVFFSPALFSSVPELGNDPEFVAETGTINIPLHIFQAAKHSNRWHFPALLERLRKDAAISSEIMDGVTSLFYREDTTPQTLAMLEAMPAKIQQVVPQLRQQTVPLIATGTAREVSAGSSGLNTRLKPYRGQVEATPFSLLDTNGERFEFRNEPGKVTLINFWATWCPPCVKEIPSLNRLKQQMQGKPFELISIDYAEDAQRIREFMDKVDVHFPVLLDPDGKLAGQWKVVAFPSTFVIGPDGKIHYGVNAGIHWDTPEVIELLDQLLQLPQQP
jgi:thiol-disulfide isomerase/thioredoxin